MRVTPRRPILLALATAAALAASPLANGGGKLLAQTHDRGGERAPDIASAYLPLGHWAYPILDYWISLGRIDDLSPFTQPYRRIDVARAVRDLEGQRLKPFEERWLERLEEELAPELDALSGGRDELNQVLARGEVGATYYSQMHRDPLRPVLVPKDGEDASLARYASDRVLDREFVDLSGQIGIVAGAIRAGRDRRYLYDPQFPRGRAVPRKELPGIKDAGLRVNEAYAELQTKFARIFVGRMYRNWGPPLMHGFLRSDYAYSYDEIGYRLGTRKIFLIGGFSTFGDFRGDTTHYFSVHRLEWRPSKGLMIGLSESVVWGGPNGKFQVSLVNPVAPWQVISNQGETPQNNVGQLDLWARPVRGLVFYGSGLFDSTNSPNKTDKSCCQIGGSLGLELPTVAPGWILRLQGTAIQSLAYRTSLPWEEYTVEHIGLGWDKADLYLLTLQADWFARGDLLLRPRLDLQIKGEGDFHRQLRPPSDQLPAFPRILVGTVERTLRPSLSGQWRPGRVRGWGLDVDWDLGLDWIRNYEHIPGDDRTDFVGTFGVTLETPRGVLGID